MITGAGGYVGSHLVQHLAQQANWSIVGAVRTISSPAVEPLPCPVVPCDLGEPVAVEAMIASAMPDIVVNLAAFARLGDCEQQRSRALTDNIVSIHNLSSQLKRVNPSCRLIHVSTDMIFDGVKGDYAETDTPRPLSWYGLTKLEGEKIALGSDLNAAVLRSALVFGPAVREKQSFLSWAVHALRNGSGTFFCDEIRTPLFVGDLVRVIAEMSVHPAKGIFHVAGDEKLSRSQFAEAIVESNELTGPVQSGRLADAEDFALRPRDLSMVTHKLKNAIGFVPTPLSEALRLCRQAEGLPAA